MKTRLSITGMHCASCVSKVESALGAVDGVSHVSVNLASEDAVVEFDSSKTSAESLIQAVHSAGYGASIPGSTAVSPEDNLRKLKVQVGVALALSFATMALGMAGAPDWILLVVSAPVQFWCGASFLRGFMQDLGRREASMDTLVALGTLSAWGYSAALTILSPSNHDVYFEIAAFLVTFILLGRFLEARARSRTQSAIRELASLLPSQAHVLRQGKLLDIALSDIFAGDTLLVRPGERVPVDGLILTGASAIDESTLTGESVPVDKEPGQPVSAGTLNTTGAFEMRATRVGEATLLSQIVETVRRAQASKAPIQRYADLVSSYFVPSVLVIALITFGVWLALTHSVGTSILPAVAVLIISCPCALGLATPAAIIVSMGKATEKGILIRDAKALETFGKVRAIVFDKTGTLTYGKPVLKRIQLLNSEAPTLSEDDALLWAASAENASEHLFARAIVQAAHQRDLTLKKVERFKAFPGGGIEARIEGREIRIGSPAFLEKHQVDVQALNGSEAFGTHSGSSWIALALDRKLAASFEILDLPRPEAQAVLRQIRDLGIKPSMISGDRVSTARFIGTNLGLNDGEIFGGISPTGKADQVGAIARDVQGPVAMVGDGVNDAPALAQADVGIAIGGGADVAVESASITLLRPSLTGVSDAFLLSKRTMRTIRQNLFASFFYNALGIPVAAGILYPWTGWKLNPMIAGAAMALSSVSVVLNSLRLKRWNWTA